MSRSMFLSRTRERLAAQNDDLLAQCEILGFEPRDLNRKRNASSSQIRSPIIVVLHFRTIARSSAGRGFDEAEQPHRTFRDGGHLIQKGQPAALVDVINQVMREAK